ncbi:DNA-processing protein DprA [Dethiobacter alkaliphilus]|uniref:DNA protecting protein DprA n=1 Tax=Dethiobacter alkaliphilus AHT 1 TaxID=555088 RepID=C0GIT4_DETAL|nr:DNA-processing protein DprA [Dethiobacter alkaliphilus]EEG76748.1 DNA protecting protein DprA [Dethiobacter alkaliphilus AHT 1]
MRDLPFWVALSKVSTLGARRILRLIAYFGTAEKAFLASMDDLLAAGLPVKAARALCDEREGLDPHRVAEEVHGSGFGVLTLACAGYPLLLAEIYDPPAVLYYRGDIDVLSTPCVAMVGSRKATEYGKNAALKLAGQLAAAGITVVSGMARGIDTWAHAGALGAGGPTIAVLGCGPDVCYPPENLKLREKIVSGGIILSEFPPGTQPKPGHFPLRNRIISGLSRATVVVEAAEKSGALITADCALEHGREVFAVPGNVNSPYSRGCHRLLKEGAAMAEKAADILAALGMSEQETAATKAVQLSDTQASVLETLQYEPAHFDEIADRCGLPAPQLAATLVELELAGLLRKLPGNFFLRV